MFDFFKELAKLPFWGIAMILGVILIALPCVTIDKDYLLNTHQPNTLLLIIVGVVLVLFSCIIFVYTLIPKASANAENFSLDMTRVKEKDGIFSTAIDDCEVRVMYGRIEDCFVDGKVVIALPCNEYFDDRCIEDSNSALGAYINRKFEGQVSEFASLMKEECKKRWGSGSGSGSIQQKTSDERIMSFGTGRCLLLLEPLGRSNSVALVSTTTERADRGLEGKISYLFDGMRELIVSMAQKRLVEVILPVLGAGHGGVNEPLAFVGLLLAIAEAVRLGPGPRLRRVTIIVFKSESKASKIDETIIRRALALIGTKN
jgi:hypothetical protein